MCEECKNVEGGRLHGFAIRGRSGRLESGWIHSEARAKRLSEEFKELILTDLGQQMRIELKNSVESHSFKWIYDILQGCRAKVACQVLVTNNKIRGTNGWNIFESVFAERFGTFSSSKLSMFYQMYNHHIDLHVPSVKYAKYVTPRLAVAADHTVPATGDTLVADVEDAEPDDTLIVDPADAKEAEESSEEMRKLYEQATSMGQFEKTMYAFNVALIAALFALSRSQ